MSDKQFHTWEDAVSWLMAQPEQQELVQACYYDRPLQGAADRYWHSPEWQEIRAFFPVQSGQALDIGAGNGIASYALAKDGWQVSALEPDPSALVGVGAIQQLAAENQLPIRVVQEFAERLPFADATFDLVFARQVLHHAQDLPQFCREIFRVLKPGGRLIAVRDHVVSSQNDLPKFFEIHPLHKLYGGENAYRLPEYTGAIKAAGLQMEQIIGPFDSVINYAPRSEAELKQELKQRFHRLPLGGIAANWLLGNGVSGSFFSLLSRVDQRPGRLFSFVACKGH
jgi:SAM-dependent methyltransferase